MNDHLPPPSQRDRLARIWLLLALAGPVVLYVGFGWLSTSRVGGVRVLFDSYDPLVYFGASRWVPEGGVLYRDVLSEYPPTANVIFAAVRAVSEFLKPFPSPFDSFVWAWMSAAWLTYLAVVRLTLKHLPRHAVWLWLNPVVIYFSLQRFDIYPAAFTLLALIAASRDRYLTAALWLGLAASLKGYPLFVVPAFALFVLKRADLRRAAEVSAISAVVFVAPIVCVASYAGWDAATLPFKYHAARGLDPDARSSSYDAAIDVLGIEAVAKLAANPAAPRVLQLATVLLAASLFPCRVDQFANAALIAVTGFISFSLFFSPQFVIWLVPFAAFSNSRIVRAMVHATLIATWLFFPLAYDLKAAHPDSVAMVRFYGATVLVMTLMRFGVIAAALAAVWTSRSEPDSPK